MISSADFQAHDLALGDILSSLAALSEGLNSQIAAVKAARTNLAAASAKLATAQDVVAVATEFANASQPAVQVAAVAAVPAAEPVVNQEHLSAIDHQRHTAV